MNAEYTHVELEALRAKIKRTVIGCGVGWLVLGAFTWWTIDPVLGVVLFVHAFIHFAAPNRSMLKVSGFGFLMILLLELQRFIKEPDAYKILACTAAVFGIFTLYRLLRESRVLLDTLVVPIDDAATEDETPPGLDESTHNQSDSSGECLVEEGSPEVQDAPLEDPLPDLRRKLKKTVKEYGVGWLIGAAVSFFFWNDPLTAVIWTILGVLHFVFPNRTLLLVTVYGFVLLCLSNALAVAESPNIQTLATTIFLLWATTGTARLYRSFEPLEAPKDPEIERRMHPLTGWVSTVLSVGSLGWLLLLLIVILIRSWCQGQPLFSEDLPEYFVYLFLISPFCAFLGTLVGVQAVFQRRRRRFLGMLGFSIGLAVSVIYLSLYFALDDLPYLRAPILAPMVPAPSPPTSDL